ncbi:MAG TPA: hypothetical protein VMY99_05110 [Nevskiaceae bacterium]|nr:hypothetical protein [Nevskiaceae bacterium]
MNTTHRAQAGHTVVYGVLAVVVLAVVGLAAWRVTVRSQTTKSTHAAKIASPANTSQTAAPLSNGIDDASLAKDLATMDDSLSQSGQNLQAATSAVNDQDQAISVPTE